MGIAAVYARAAQNLVLPPDSDSPEAYPAERERTGKMVISPKYDDMMKELFHNDTVLRYFLSDVLRLPPDGIRNLRMRDTFLRRRRKQEKQGILDVAAEFGGDTSRPKAHTGYRLRDEDGNELTDALEIHLLELNKPLTGEDRAEEWIRFFNVKEEEELRMIKVNTKNPGILEAVRELQRLSMNPPLKRRYDAYLKRKRDEKAREAYVREEGEAIGEARGEARGEAKGENYKLASLVCRKLRKGKRPEIIAEELEEDLEVIQKICQAAEEFGPEYDEKKVFAAFMKPFE